MAGTSFPVARLLDLGIPITWQEAVAVVDAADLQSAATGIPVTLEHCHVTAAGDVHLSRSGSSDARDTVSSLQLLEALLEGQASPGDLRILAASVDRECPDNDAKDRRLQVDVCWCLSSNPRTDVARLAARALSAHPEAGEELTLPPAEAQVLIPRIVEAAPRPPGGPDSRRPPAVALRLEPVTPAVVLALVAVLLAAIGGGAAATGALLVDSGPSRAEATQLRQVDTPDRRGAQPRTRRSVSAEPVVLPTLLTR